MSRRTRRAGRIRTMRLSPFRMWHRMFSGSGCISIAESASHGKLVVRQFSWCDHVAMARNFALYISPKPRSLELISNRPSSWSLRTLDFERNNCWDCGTPPHWRINCAFGIMVPKCGEKRPLPTQSVCLSHNSFHPSHLRLFRCISKFAAVQR